MHPETFVEINSTSCDCASLPAPQHAQHTHPRPPSAPLTNLQCRACFNATLPPVANYPLSLVDTRRRSAPQVAAPVGTDRLEAPVLLGPGGKPAVKLFIFAPAECYDFVSQVRLRLPPNRVCMLYRVARCGVLWHAVRCPTTRSATHVEGCFGSAAPRLRRVTRWCGGHRGSGCVLVARQCALNAPSSPT